MPAKGQWRRNRVVGVVMGFVAKVLSRIKKGVSKRPRQGFGFLLSSPGNFLGLGFGAGLFPWAPATFASLLAVPIHMSVAWGLGWWGGLSLAVASLAVGPWACAAAARRMGVEDPSEVVWDEMAAMWLLLSFAPEGPWWGLACFLVFRVFDIAKPWPIGWVDEKVGGGLGIMLDDVLAAIMSCGLLWAVSVFFAV